MGDASAANSEPASPTGVVSESLPMELDHVVLGTRDLEASAALICERLAVQSSEPRLFPSLGFRTVIVLAEPPLELCDVVDQEAASREPWTASLSKRVAEGESLIAWAVRVPNASTEAGRLGLHVRPSGTFDTVGLDPAYETGVVPFFIAYRSQPEHRKLRGTGESRVTAVCISDPDKRLDRWLGGVTRLPLRLVEGRPGLVALEFQTPQGPWFFSDAGSLGVDRP